MTRWRIFVVASTLCTATPALAQAQTVDEWVTIGTRIHGGYGAFIPTGIRIGLDAVQRLKAGPREISVVFHSGPKAPCACIADGIMAATTASPGQGTLQVSAEPSPEGTLGVALIRHRKTGETLRYVIPGAAGAKLVEINKSIADPAARHRAVMEASDLFLVEPVGAR